VPTNSPAPTTLLACPHGLDHIRATFGDTFQYVLPDHTLDPRWQDDFLVRITLPFPLPFSWDKSGTVTQMTCHQLMTGIFADVFERLRGIAIGLNPETNPQGTEGNMDPGVVTIFRGAGFEWGGDWPGRVRDPMHFQFCTGY
jgi:hypothetical protein